MRCDGAYKKVSFVFSPHKCSYFDDKLPIRKLNRSNSNGMSAHE